MASPRKDIESLLETLESNYLGWSSNMAPAIMGAPDQPRAGGRADQQLLPNRSRDRQAVRARDVPVGRSRRAARLTTPTLIIQCNDDMIAPVAVGEYMQRDAAPQHPGHHRQRGPLPAPQRAQRLRRRPSTRSWPRSRSLTAPAERLRRPSPEALALLDAAPCGLLQTAADGTVPSRQPNCFASGSAISAEELVGKRRFQDLLTMGGRIFHQTHWAPLLQMQGSISEVKLELLASRRERHPRGAERHARRERRVDRARDRRLRGARSRQVRARAGASRKRLEELVAEAKRLQAEAKDRARLRRADDGHRQPRPAQPAVEASHMGDGAAGAGRPDRQPAAACWVGSPARPSAPTG